MTNKKTGRLPHRNHLVTCVSILMFATMVVLAETTYDCSNTAPTCPQEGERCGPGLAGTFELTNYRTTFWYACNGKGDCGSGMPASGKCNVWSKVEVEVADLVCTATSDSGVCIVGVRGQPVAMNRRCDTGGPCVGQIADPLPALDPGYSGATGHPDTTFPTPVLPVPPDD